MDNFISTDTTTWRLTEISTDKQTLVRGKLLPQDKRIYAISSSYMFYFATPTGLRKFNAFNYTLEEQDGSY